MKNLFTILLAFIIISCHAQIYPLNTSSSDVPDNAYIKDTNNELDKYVGLWKGSWNGKNVYLEFKKNKKYYSGNHPYYIDEIVGERKIINSNGTIEIDRISTFDLLNAEFWGMTKSLKYLGKYSLSFFPKNMCGKTATIHITNITSTQMTLNMEYNPSFFKADCIHNAYVDQNNDWPFNFPKDIVLTKQ